MNFRLITLLVVLIVAAHVVSVKAATIYVSLLGSNSAPYTSWDDASRTIQTAIDEASSGDTVRVGDGTYTGPGNRDIDFHGKGILVSSLNGPGAVTIDCADSVTHGHRGFVFWSGEDSTSVLRGFRIVNGHAPLEPRNPLYAGGAIRCDSSSSPQILDCVFDANSGSFYGSAIFIGGLSFPKVSNCLFVNNRSVFEPITATGRGGAIAIAGASANVLNCTFVNNIANLGGAIAADSAFVLLKDCIFYSNRAIQYDPFESLYGSGTGGAIFLSDARAQIEGCTFSKNSAESRSPVSIFGGEGGAVGVIRCSLSISTTTFFKNMAFRAYPIDSYFPGSCIWLSGSHATIDASLFSHDVFGRAVRCAGTGSSVSIQCSNIFANFLGDWTGCLEGLEARNGNLSIDPLYCDSSSLPLDLTNSSLCLASNNSCGVQMGSAGIGCIVTFVGDVNQSGDVTGADVVFLARYLFSKGEFPYPLSRGDLDCNGRVSILDVIHLVSIVYRGAVFPSCVSGLTMLQSRNDTR